MFTSSGSVQHLLNLDEEKNHPDHDTQVNLYIGKIVKKNLLNAITVNVIG